MQENYVYFIIAVHVHSLTILQNKQFISEWKQFVVAKLQKTSKFYRRLLETANSTSILLSKIVNFLPDLYLLSQWFKALMQSKHLKSLYNIYAANFHLENFL